MTQHRDDWNDMTEPGTPRTLAIVKRLTDKANEHDITLRDVMESLGKVMGAVAALGGQVAALGSQVDALREAVERLEKVALGAARTAEASSHDLSAFATETRRKFMLKNASLPTAIVCAAFIVGYAVLAAMGKPIPPVFVAVAGAISTAIAGMLPALLGGGVKS